MNRIILFTIVLFSLPSLPVFAQDIVECEKIVAVTVESINSKTSNKLDKYLSDDFSIAGQTGEIAKMVLPALFSQLNDTVIKYKKISETKSDSLTLVYEIEYTKKGKQTSTFVFNNKNQLKELQLFKMEVKTMKPAEIKTNNRGSISIPFKKVGDLILVQAEVNGEKRNFLFDNGAPELVLNSHINKMDTNTKKNSLSNAQGINGNISGMDIEKLKKFDFYGIHMENQDVITMDLSNVQRQCKTEIYGLIGYNVFKDYDILFDYKSSKITLLNPDSTDNYVKYNFKGSKTSEVPLIMNAHIATVKGTIAGKELNFGIDCGAETNLLDENLFAIFKDDIVKLKSDSLVGADKSIEAVKSGEIKLLMIGNMELKKTKTVFNSMKQLNEGYGLKLDGLIGYEVLSKQKTLLSYKRERIIFIK